MKSLGARFDPPNAPNVPNAFIRSQACYNVKQGRNQITPGFAGRNGDLEKLLQGVYWELQLSPGRKNGKMTYDRRVWTLRSLQITGEHLALAAVCKFINQDERTVSIENAETSHRLVTSNCYKYSPPGTATDHQ